MKLRSFMTFDEQWEAARQAANNEGIGISELIRKAIELYLNGSNGNTYTTIKEERVTYRVEKTPTKQTKS